MLQQWKQLLEKSGAEFPEDSLVSFGKPDHELKALSQGNILCDLSHVGIIQVQGADAADFLQNQLTNDVNLVTESQAQLSAWCNHKGRTIATFLVHKQGDNYYLTLSADLMDFVLKRLQMFVMRSAVQLEAVTESVVHFGFSGSQILQHWNNCCDVALPDQDYSVEVSGDLSIIKIPGVEPRYEVIAPFDTASLLWGKLNAHSTSVSGKAWDYLNIASGIPVIKEASREAWIPQMLNFHIIDGVSFKKGCFPGQEVVARLKYLGKTKRRIFRLEFATDVIPEIGTSVVAEGESTEAGKVVNAALNPAGNVEALAVLKIAMAEAEKELSLGNTDEIDGVDGIKGAKATLLELPYATEELE